MEQLLAENEAYSRARGAKLDALEDRKSVIDVALAGCKQSMANLRSDVHTPRERMIDPLVDLLVDTHRQVDNLSLVVDAINEETQSLFNDVKYNWASYVTSMLRVLLAFMKLLEEPGAMVLCLPELNPTYRQFITLIDKELRMKYILPDPAFLEEMLPEPVREKLRTLIFTQRPLSLIWLAGDKSVQMVSRVNTVTRTATLGSEDNSTLVVPENSDLRHASRTGLGMITTVGIVIQCPARQ